MKTPIWLAVICLAASLPIQAETLKPIELNDQELSVLRGRYVMPGRIISFGIAMSSTWQNANGEVIGATSTMQIQQSTITPQFYVSVIDEKGNGSTGSPGTGTVTGGNGLNSIEGVTTFQQRADAATDKMCVANSPAQLTTAQACRVAVRAEINEKLALAQAAQANRSTQLASR